MQVIAAHLEHKQTQSQHSTHIETFYFRPLKKKIKMNILEVVLI